jgi:hypothetical protein
MSTCIVHWPNRAPSVILQQSRDDSGSDGPDAPAQSGERSISSAKRRRGIATLFLGPEHKTVVKVVYSDESGTGGDLKREPITVVTAIVMNLDSQWVPVRDRIERAIEEVYPGKNLAKYSLKGKNLYHQIERDDPKAADLMALLMAVPLREKVQVVHGAVDRDGFKYHMENIHLNATFEERDAIRPFRIAFEHCINRIDAYMRTTFPKEQVLWIHDGGSLNEHAKHQLRDLRALLKEFENDSALRTGYEESRRRTLEPEVLLSYVADMIYFGDDKESRLLQLADVCCSTIARALRGDVCRIAVLRNSSQSDTHRRSAAVLREFS